MVEIGLVRLELREVLVIEVAWVSQLRVLEHDDAASVVSDRQVPTKFVKLYGRKYVRFCDLIYVSLAQPIDIYPLYGVGAGRRLRLCFLFLRRGFGTSIIYR